MNAFQAESRGKLLKSCPKVFRSIGIKSSEAEACNRCFPLSIFRRQEALRGPGMGAERKAPLLSACHCALL